MQIYVDARGYLKYDGTGYDPNWQGRQGDKQCEVSAQPIASYNCPPKELTCAIATYKDGGDSGQDPRARDAWAANLRWVLLLGMAAFPQSCVGDSWGSADRLGAGKVPAGKTTLALYALRTALS